MKSKVTIQSIFLESFVLIKKNPLLLLFFYGFVMIDVLISFFVAGDVGRVLLFIFGLVTIGLPGIKVAFLDDLYQGKKPQYKQTVKLLGTYFGKLFLVNLFLILIGGLFFVASNAVIGFFGSAIDASLLNLVRMVVYLPLALAYFSLFHLFVVILVKKGSGITESLAMSVEFVKGNRKIVFAIVLLSLLIHYPVSEFLMIAVSRLPIAGDNVIVRALLAGVNVAIDLYFFAVWMVLYNKKS
jgi:hypothetical protein